VRIAVVTATGTEPWREEEIVCARLAGALACEAEVDVLVADGGGSGTSQEGAVRTIRFAAEPWTIPRRRALLVAIAGGTIPRTPLACSCLEWAAARALSDAPRYLQTEMTRSLGGDAPSLYEHIRSTPYDALLFVGYRGASTWFGLGAVADDRRVMLLPLACEEPLLHLSIYDEVFARVDRILVLTETERELVERRFGVRDSGRVRKIGFALQVNRIAETTEPLGFEGKPVLAVSGASAPPRVLRTFFEKIRKIDTEVEVCLLSDVEPSEAPGTNVRTCRTRVDFWRWMSRAIAVIDPVPHRILARDVLEAMLYGTPVIVEEEGGASREHAEVGNGGLWYRDSAELAACIGALRSDATRRALGAQGRGYAEREYGDPAAFVQRVTDAVFG
jgi:hypothetical protein